MIREIRIRTAGVIFYLIFGICIIATQKASNFLFSTDFEVKYQTVAAIIGVGAILFTSDAIGFIFVMLYSFIWNFGLTKFKKREGGYSTECQKLSYDIKRYIISEYKKSTNDLIKGNFHSRFEHQFELYTNNVYLSYFWMQAPKRLIEWSSRHNSTFIACMSTVVSILIGLIFSIIIILILNMGFTKIHMFIYLLSFILILILWMNAKYARKEAWQIVDLWLSETFNPILRKIIEKMKGESIHNFRE